MRKGVEGGEGLPGRSSRGRVRLVFAVAGADKGLKAPSEHSKERLEGHRLTPKILQGLHDGLNCNERCQSRPGGETADGLGAGCNRCRRRQRRKLKKRLKQQRPAARKRIPGAALRLNSGNGTDCSLES